MHLLVEKVVVDFDLSVGFKVIGQQHDRNRHLVEIIDLQRIKTLCKQSVENDRKHCLTTTFVMNL